MKKKNINCNITDGCMNQVINEENTYYKQFKLLFEKCIDARYVKFIEPETESDKNRFYSIITKMMYYHMYDCRKYDAPNPVTSTSLSNFINGKDPAGKVIESILFVYRDLNTLLSSSDNINRIITEIDIPNPDMRLILSRFMSLEDFVLSVIVFHYVDKLQYSQDVISKNTLVATNYRIIKIINDEYLNKHNNPSINLRELLNTSSAPDIEIKGSYFNNLSQFFYKKCIKTNLSLHRYLGRISEDKIVLIQPAYYGELKKLEIYVFHKDESGRNIIDWRSTSELKATLYYETVLRNIISIPLIKE